MADPQGVFRFPGVDVVRSGSYTLAPGVYPGAARIETVPHDFQANDGDLEIEYSDVTITIRDCRVDQASLSVGSGGQIWTFQILDRRWRWQYGDVSGAYNMLDARGDVIPATERTPQQLATLLLDAMGEGGFNVGELPNDTRPRISWDHVNPASELASLCGGLNCKIILGLDDNVAIRALDPDGLLPPGPATNVEQPHSRQIKPDSVLVVGGPIAHETMFALEPVGVDTDGTVKPIDELSYKPAEGWDGQFPPTFGDVTGDKNRELATKTVWRWYRIAKIVGSPGTFALPTGPDNADERKHVLPIQSELLDVEQADDGTRRRKPAEIRGVFYLPLVLGDNSAADREYVGSYSIDAKNGIVKFGEPVYRFIDADGDDEPETPRHADLYLKATFSYTDPATGQKQRFTHDLDTPGERNDTGPFVERRDDVRRTVQHVVELSNSENDGDRFRFVNADDNQQTAVVDATAIITEIQKRFEPLGGASVRYAGFLEIEPDGAIQQVTWSTGPAVTTASRHTEHDISTLTVAEMRRRERLQQIESLKKLDEAAAEADSFDEFVSLGVGNIA